MNDVRVDCVFAEELESVWEEERIINIRIVVFKARTYQLRR